MSNFKCGKCGATFSSRDDLRRHIFNEHLYPDEKSRREEDSDEAKDAMSSVEKLIVPLSCGVRCKAVLPDKSRCKSTCKKPHLHPGKHECYLGHTW